MACRSSGCWIPRRWTWDGRWRSSSGCSHAAPPATPGSTLASTQTRPPSSPRLPFRPSLARDTFQWKVFERRQHLPVAVDGTPDSRQETARWRVAVTVAFALGGITVATWGPRLPTIESDLHIGTGTIGFLLVGVTIGAILGLLASTPLLHRLGSRRALTAGLLLTAVAMAVMGVALG